MNYRDAEHATIHATPQECLDALVDYEHLPEWQPVLRSVTVAERDEMGRGSVVDHDGRTEVSLAVNIDPDRFVAGPVRSRIRDLVMTRALRDLRTYQEASLVR